MLTVLPDHVHVLPVWVSACLRSRFLVYACRRAHYREYTVAQHRANDNNCHRRDLRCQHHRGAGRFDRRRPRSTRRSPTHSRFFLHPLRFGGQRSDLLFAVLGNRSGGPYARASKSSGKAGLGLSATGDTRGPSANWRPLFSTIYILIQHGDGVQPHRCPAAYASRQDVDDDRKHDLALDDGHRPVTSHQRSPGFEGTTLIK